VGRTHCVLDSLETQEQIREAVVAGVRDCRRHPAIFAYLIGNEIRLIWCAGTVAEPVRRFLRRLVACVRAEHPEALVSYANYPSTEYLTVDFTDFVLLSKESTPNSVRTSGWSTATLCSRAIYRRKGVDRGDRR